MSSQASQPGGSKVENLKDLLLARSAAISNNAAEIDVANCDCSALGRVFRDLLDTPRPIGEVERIEAAAMLLWHDLIVANGCTDDDMASKFGDFFYELGFLYKYKPYGTKVATPFGYSIFDLRENRGFSFQMHIETKIEAFHVLRVKRGALIYVSSLQEWEDEGRQWATRLLLLREDVQDIPPVLRPEPGDTVKISKPGVVHTALGCVLEEYATTSLDEVERLFDQNDRSDVEIPQRHKGLSEILRGGQRGLPERRLSRVMGDGWSETAERPEAPIIDEDGIVVGKRIEIEADERVVLDSAADLITTIVALDEPVTVLAARGSWVLTPGRYVCVAPGVEASIESASRCTVSIHQIARQFASR